MPEPVPTHVPAVSRFVVGVDGSEPRRNALRWSALLAGTMGGTVEAVAVWQPMTHYGWVGPGVASMPPDRNPAVDAEKALVGTVDAVFGLLLGSVSSACAEHAACPVLVLHGATPLP